MAVTEGRMGVVNARHFLSANPIRKAIAGTATDRLPLVASVNRGRWQTDNVA